MQSVDPAERVQRAIQFFQSGQPALARRQCEKALKLDAGFFDARHLLGVMALQSGHYREAVRHLRQAARIAPDQAQAVANLATALRAIGRLREAEDEARRAVELAPSQPQFVANLGQVLADRGQWEDALACFERALEQAPQHAIYRYDVGRALNRLERYDEAEKRLREALETLSAHRDAAVELGLAIAGQRRHEEAMAWYEDWLKRDPEAFGAYYNLGQLYSEHDRHPEALAAFSEAARLVPTDAAARAQLAMEYEHGNRVEEAEKLARSALKLEPRQQVAQLALARILRRNGESAQALAMLEKIPANALPGWRASQYWNELGRLYHDAGRYAEAWRAFQRSNDLSAEHGQVDPQNYRNFVARHEETFEVARVRTWPRLADEPAPLGFEPVFHMGFPRSGTTLTDQMLAGHPEVAVLEEKAPLDALQRTVRQLELEYPQALGEPLTGELRDQLRAAYRDAVHEKLHGAAPPRIVVDKMPLYTTQAGEIARVFPEARLIFSLRHPYDVCLSCLMQNFADNPAMANFREVESAATLYARVMGLWLRYRELFPQMRVFENRYEELVRDPEGMARRVTEFLGIPFDTGMLETAERSRGVRIRTASYHQVTQPINRAAVGRWQHYLPWLGPAVPYLDPFVKAFGYPETGPAAAEQAR